MTTLIVGREPSFGCAASPRQLHDGSLNVLFGAQQCAAYAISSFPLRRAGTSCAVCGAMCCMPVVWSSVAPGDWLGTAKSGGRLTSVWLLRSVQSKTSSASTSAVSTCNRAISACSRSRLSQRSEHTATPAPAGSGLAFTATEREETKTATSRTRITAQTASRVARAWLDPDPKPAPRTIHGACKDAGTRNAVRRERSVLLPVFPRKMPYALRR